MSSRPPVPDGLQRLLADRYRIDRELGRGGMATVYLAIDLRHDRPVALKVLHADLARSLGGERFLREIRTAARLQHPHILSVHDSGDAAGILWFTMPFVEGETLRRRLERERQLPVPEALRIAREIADAMIHAHRHGVVHRDVKPENILLSDGHALLADFGVSRALTSAHTDQRITESGVSVGTPAYMSPEQASGAPVDERSDLYALGAVLYEMLAGEPPFTGPSAQVVIAKRFHTDATPLQVVRPGVPLHVAAAAARALARTPADRFASTAEFVEALASDTSPAKPAVRPAKRGLLLLAMGLLLAIGVLFAWRRARPSGPSDGEPAGQRLAVLPFENLGAAEQAYFADGIADEIRGKLSTIPGLQVTARTSSARYGGTDKAPEEIARELEVDYVLTGTVRWDEAGGKSRVRVVPELVQATSGATRWQQSFDAPLTDVFQVQADVADRVSRELGVALASGQRRHLAERPTGDLGAYDLYLKARYAWHQRTAPGLDQARGLLEQAIRMDPAFAPAYAALADVYTVMPLWSDLPPSQTYPRAKAAALQALRLDSTLASPYAALGDINAFYERNWPEAECNFRRSLALDLNNANTWHWYSEDYLIVVGRVAEAIEAGERAHKLDPLSTLMAASHGQLFYRAKRFEEAERLLREVRAIDSTFILVNLWGGQTALILGRPDEAVTLLEQSVAPGVRHSIDVATLGYGYAKAGRRRDAEKLLRELLDRRERGYVSAASIAVLTAGLGDTAETFEWLERALEERDPLLVYNFVTDPMLETFRRHPRGRALLRAMRLPEER